MLVVSLSLARHLQTCIETDGHGPACAGTTLLGWPGSTSVAAWLRGGNTLRNGAEIRRRLLASPRNPVTDGSPIAHSAHLRRPLPRGRSSGIRQLIYRRASMRRSARVKPDRQISLTGPILIIDYGLLYVYVQSIELLSNELPTSPFGCWHVTSYPELG
jgi:hypothetical protein